MITIKKVSTIKEKHQFVDFPLKLYKNNPYFVPPLYADEMKMFKKNYVYHDQAEDVFFLAYEGKKVVGRIQGILQRVSNEKEKCKRVRFTRFDASDNQEVADALFNAIEEWAKEKEMDTVVGPLGYSDLEREGLLIEGFEELSTFEEQYNYPYYQKMIENCGYSKEVDWVERKLYYPKECDGRLSRISSLMMRRCKLHFGESKNANDFIKKYGNQFFEILDETYKNIYGTVPFTKGMKDMLISNFKLIIDVKYVAVILDENNKVVCFGLCFPSIAKAVQKSQGHLTLPCIYRILKATKHPEILELGLVGVLPEYQMMGIASAIIAKLQEYLKDGKIKYAETNLNLEDNTAIINQWKNFDAIQNKRRRCFIKKISL